MAIKFYKLGDESDNEVITYDNKRIEINNLKEKEKQEDEYSKTVNVGLKNVIDKDMEELSNKLALINKKIITTVSTNNIIYTEKLEDNIENVNELLIQVENLISKVIIEKGKIRIGIFTTKKDEKRERLYKER